MLQLIILLKLYVTTCDIRLNNHIFYRPDSLTHEDLCLIRYIITLTTYVHSVYRSEVIIVIGSDNRLICFTTLHKLFVHLFTINCC